MSLYTENSPYPSAHRPAEITTFLRKGLLIVPAGLYYIYDGTEVNPLPQRMCDLDMLAGEVSRWEARCARGVSLTSVSRNVVVCLSLES